MKLSLLASSGATPVSATVPCEIRLSVAQGALIGQRCVFLTQDSDRDVVKAALSTGAQDYVLKADARIELFTALKGVLGGDGFVSSGIEVRGSGETEDQ